jgi:hypothetical protein
MFVKRSGIAGCGSSFLFQFRTGDTLDLSPASNIDKLKFVVPYAENAQG